MIFFKKSPKNCRKKIPIVIQNFYSSQNICAGRHSYKTVGLQEICHFLPKEIVDVAVTPSLPLST
jgi:hypothetical protein